MNSPEVEAFYRRYIARLNDCRGGGLGEFVRDELTYNGKPMTLADYEQLIVGNFAAIPDLRFDIDLLVAGSDQVACRLRYDCTPTGEFLGLQPTGRRVSFAEHVFYKLYGGKICEVWSLIDRPAIERQLIS